MAAPRIEPEVILKLRSTLPAGNLTAEALAPFIEWASIGFEVVDSHYPDWRFTGADAAADFGLHAVLVIGTPWLIGSESAEHLLPALEGLRVTLRSNQGFLAKGEGRNALGSPLLALCQLHDVLGGQSWAPPLVAGEVITTGTLTALPYVHPGECYRVEIEGAPLGHLELEFCT
jgi:2-oxo-3-hexenedioate decarboxylase